MSGRELFRVADGLATLGPDLARVLDVLEARLLSWADECGAERMVFAPLVSVDDLATLDYFRNFPHLVQLTSSIDPDGLPADPATVARDGTVAAAQLAPSRYALPSAACYSAYLHLRGSRVASARHLTTVATCFRRETHYAGLRRLNGFRMREIICVGTREAVQAHLSAFKPRVADLGRRLGLQLEVRPATDPFFEPGGGRALMQQLFPVKEEFLHDGSLAIASVNFHRTFFGERCRISLANGGPAFTGCVAFGLERWLAALLDTYGEDADAMVKAFTAADPGSGAVPAGQREPASGEAR
jgi:seryl-tRNA synthetase